MLKRNTKQRREMLITYLNKQGEVSVDDLVSYFATSAVTIRKDLSTLEEDGLLIRRFGGAVALPKKQEQLKADNLSKRKLAIAELAATFMQDRQRIIIDTGDTTAALVPLVANKKELVVMTNSLKIANQLHELTQPPTILMTGGTWDPNSESFQGQVAEQVLRSYDFDQLFIGADGIDIARGTTTFNELVGLSRVMAEVAREVTVMVESEKIGRKIPNLELAWQDVTRIITDDQLPASTKQALIARGVNVVCATSKN